MTDIPKLAASLTKAQAYALKHGRWNMGSLTSWFIAEGLVKRPPGRAKLTELEISGLGLAVRAYLMEQDAHPHSASHKGD